MPPTRKGRILTTTKKSEDIHLGIEAGATRIVGILADSSLRCLQRLEVKQGANLRLLTDAQLVQLLQSIASQIPRPTALGIGMAGALDEPDRHRIRAAAAHVWQCLPCWAGHDLETALAAAPDSSDKPARTRVVVISGTGASCYGKKPNGTEVLTAGWGHMLGDGGSGYDIALRALQAVFLSLDESGNWPQLGRRFLRALKLKTPQDLISWSGCAEKSALAALAIQVFLAEKSGDPIASGILQQAAAMISHNAISCASRLAQKGATAEFFLTGSVLQKQPTFTAQVTRLLKSAWPGASVELLEREGAWGAVELAIRAQGNPCFQVTAPTPLFVPQSRGLSPTEQRNPLSRKLDKMSVPSAIRLMLGEDATLPAALIKEEKKISKAVQMIVHAFRKGGRLFYVGAGTSGRLGALDAYECPPTFSVSPNMVQAIVAGGDQAMQGAQEDAEDDAEGGKQALQNRGIAARDVVIGIAASGRTPFVWGALGAARQAGAASILVCFNPNLLIPSSQKPDLVISPNIGPEILTGSTRLKAGTATKLLLNIFTTLSMVQLGKVLENLMVDVLPTNDKLRDRAIRIARELTGASREETEKALRRHDWSIKTALPGLKKSQTPGMRF